MAENGEFSGGHESTESLEQKVLEIFKEARAVLNGSRGRFSTFAENPYNDALESSVKQLPLDALADLIRGIRVYDQYVDRDVELWAREELTRKLGKTAYSAYVNNRNEVTESLLRGKRLTVTKLGDVRRSAITYSDGFTETMGSSPDSASGEFVSANVNVGEIILRADEPTKDRIYWHASLIDSLSGVQLLGLRIEEPEHVQP